MHGFFLDRLFDEVDLRLKSTIPRGSTLKMSDLRGHAINLGLVPDHAASLGDRGPKVPTPI